MGVGKVRPGKPTDGIEELLDFLYQNNIRTGVISNISYCGQAVTDRINEVIPANHFEFIIATSEYMYRKPNRRIFDLALGKAGLNADEVWYVGDQYECDVVGAKNAGIFPVWYQGTIDVPGDKKGDVTVVRDWQEFRECIVNSVMIK